MATAPAPVRECKQRDDLDRAFQMSLADCERAVNILDWVRGQTKREQYERLQKYIDETRVKSKEARSALDTHIEEHGC